MLLWVYGMKMTLNFCVYRHVSKRNHVILVLILKRAMALSSNPLNHSELFMEPLETNLIKINIQQCDR